MAQKDIHRLNSERTMASEAMHSGEIFITKEDQKKLKFVIEQALRSNQEDKRHLKKLKDELIRAHVVDAQDVPADTVTMNSVVSIKDMDTGDEEVYELGYSGYAPDKGNRISVFAPIGMALLGYRAGDEIEWEVPGGMRKIKIIKVLYQPEASGHYDL